MTANLRRRGGAAGLTGRISERDMLARLVDAVRAGESQALVVRGDPGVGKTALLEHLTGRASGSGCRVPRAVGVQSEMELVFAGLHQLCARRCWATSTGFRCRSARRCGPRWGSLRGRRRTGFWWGWRC